MSTELHEIFGNRLRGEGRLDSLRLRMPSSARNGTLASTVHRWQPNIARSQVVHLSIGANNSQAMTMRYLPRNTLKLQCGVGLVLVLRTYGIWVNVFAAGHAISPLAALRPSFSIVLRVCLCTPNSRNLHLC